MTTSVRCLCVIPLLWACTEPPREPPAPRVPVEVRFAGCAEVRRGPVCLLKAERTLTVWVRRVPGIVFDVVAAGRTLEAVTAEVEGGRRLEVKVPEGASVLTVAPRGARGRWASGRR